MILRWHLRWNASSCFASACRMVLVSELYILASACRMVQVSKPFRQIEFTMHYACLLCNIRATPVLTRDRDPRKISDSINDVSNHIGLCIKWSSFKILNIGFLPGSNHSKRPKASWKRESIIDNRSPNFLGSHRADIFHIRLYKIYSKNRKENS